MSYSTCSATIYRLCGRMKVFEESLEFNLNRVTYLTIPRALSGEQLYLESLEYIIQHQARLLSSH